MPSPQPLAPVGPLEERDYYTVLNVDRTASPAEIRAAYLHLATCLHPDKVGQRGTLAVLVEDGVAVGRSNDAGADRAQRQAEFKRMADEQFCLVDKAYRVLADPIKRKAYDEFGGEVASSLDTSEDDKDTLAFYLRYPHEVREMLLEQLREERQRRFDASLGTTGDMTVYCALQPLQDGVGQPQLGYLVQLHDLRLDQHVTVPLSSQASASFGARVTHQLHPEGAKGDAAMDLGLSHQVGQNAVLVGHARMGAGGGFDLEYARTMSGNTQAKVSGGSANGTATLVLESTHQFSWRTTVTASLAMVADATSHSFDVIRLTVTHALGGAAGALAKLQVSFGDVLGLYLDYRRNIGDRGTGAVSVGWSADGWEANVSKSTRINTLSRLKVGLRLCHQGAFAVLKCRRGGFQLHLPLLAGATASPIALTIASVLPVIVNGVVQAIVDTGDRERAAKLYGEARGAARKGLKRARTEAASQIRLMARSAKAKAAQEAEKGGLVIQCARYGRDLHQDFGADWWAQDAPAAPETEDEGKDLPPANIDVTIPLQFFVKDSQLRLPEASNSSLLGFYAVNLLDSSVRHQMRRAALDTGARLPELGDRREITGLYIRYVLSGRVFDIIFDDLDPVELPAPRALCLGHTASIS